MGSIGTSDDLSPVPLFNLSDLKSGKHLEQFRNCLKDKGIFYLSGCGVTQDDHTVARQAVVDFFLHGTDAEKQAVTLPDRKARRGFSALEWESTAVVTDTGKYSDYSMCFSMGRTENLFPTPGFEAVWQRYFDQMYSASQDVARVALEAAGAQPEGGLDAFLDCDPLLRLRYFPEVPKDRVAEEEPLRMGPHYDLSIVTLVHQTACENGFVSLQCEVDGAFVNLPTKPDTVVAFCGSVASLASDGAIKAPKHRVRSPGRDQRVGSSRTSSVFFLRPSPGFRFSVPRARELGFNVTIPMEEATFGDWLGGNYVRMRTDTPAT